MIKQEQIKINGRMFVKTYSDAGKFIVQNGTGVKYEEAIDIPNKYSYTESVEDILVEKVEEEIKEE